MAALGKEVGADIPFCIYEFHFHLRLDCPLH